LTSQEQSKYRFHLNEEVYQGKAVYRVTFDLAGKAGKKTKVLRGLASCWLIRLSIGLSW